MAGQPDSESLTEKVARLQEEMSKPSSRKTKAKVKKIVGEAPLREPEQKAFVVDTPKSPKKKGGMNIFASIAAIYLTVLVLAVLTILVVWLAKSLL